MSKPAVQVIAAVIPRERSQVTSDLVALTKPRVLLMVLATTLVGYFVALSGPADYVRVTHLLIGTLLAAGGTLALIAVSVLPAAIGLGGIAYVVTACVLGLGLLGAGLAHANTVSTASARRVLMASLLYLPLLLAALALDKP